MKRNRLMLAKLRREYAERPLLESQAARNPLVQFEKWFIQAIRSKLREPQAMCLATVGNDGNPAARMVLLKEFNKRGFVFASSYRSRKAIQLGQNSAAAIVFYWADLERQVRIEGLVEKTSKRDSRRLFLLRPHGSQLGAIVRPQSSKLENRAALETRYQELAKTFRGKTIPPPNDWGGYRLIPKQFEFWQGRKNRLHDRLLYTRDRLGRWKLSRLAP